MDTFVAVWIRTLEAAALTVAIAAAGFAGWLEQAHRARLPKKENP
jgi:hypothetical protein